MKVIINSVAKSLKLIVLIMTFTAMICKDHLNLFESSMNLTEAFSFMPIKINTSLSRSRSLIGIKNNRLVPEESRKNINAKPKFQSFTIRKAISNDSDSESNTDFWEQQKNLAASLTSKADAQELEVKSFFWLISPTPATSFSYALGAALGTAYSYGLGKYVETIGGSVDDVEEVQGAGVGQARFAFLILLFIIVGKLRGEAGVGLQEIPAIGGFFTYQLASLSQGLKEIND